MEGEVKVAERGELLVASKRAMVTIPSIGGLLGAAFGEIYGPVQAQGVETAGPPFVIYHGMPEGDAPFEVEVCAPVARPFDPPEGWTVATLPAGTFATLVHIGPYDSVGSAYQVLMEWIGRHDLAVAGAPREVYLSEPGTPPEETRTVIEFPVARAPAAVGRA